MMKKTIVALTVASAFIAGTASASEQPSFWGNGYIDGYQHNRTTDKDQTVVMGVEGGVTTKKHDIYGFYEYDPTNDAYFVKASDHVKMFKGFTGYGQVSHFSNNFGNETVSVAGIGYDRLNGDNWSFKPFLGYAVKDGSFAGKNGAMLGWSGFYKPGDVMFTNWTELETNADEKVTVNGAFGAFVDITKNVYTGIQYTYSYRTAGEANYGDSVALRVGIHL